VHAALPATPLEEKQWIFLCVVWPTGSYKPIAFNVKACKNCFDKKNIHIFLFQGKQKQIEFNNLFTVVLPWLSYFPSEVEYKCFFSFNLYFEVRT